MSKYSPSRLSRALFKRIWRATMLGAERGPHLSRFAMYQELPKHFTAGPGRALSISGSEVLCEKLGMTDITPADFPRYDIRHLAFPDETFDYVVSDQVLEHVEGDPFAAVEVAAVAVFFAYQSQQSGR